MKYILGIDQSTQGTKALLFDENGDLIGRADLAHEQIIDSRGFVEHNPKEILQNTYQAVKNVIAKTEIDKNDIKAIGISNQRETALVWDKVTGEPVYNAIVWQCARGEGICRELEEKGCSKLIKEHTGLNLSPYFSAAKISWVLKSVEGAREKAKNGELACGTIDSFLVYSFTDKKEFRTDYSNASRTQLFNITKLEWDREICELFEIPMSMFAKVTDSDGYFGETDLDGFLDKKIPIHSVLGDSHGALFGQGCINKGMIKGTYGTGSSIMMNIGSKPVFSESGVVTSLAWSMNGEVSYVLEGNINYTGAVITWLQKDLELINSAAETQDLAYSANPNDHTYLVPAFTGLGAPYFDSDAVGIITGVTRTTKKAEIVRAALDCIAYQITDIVNAMKESADLKIEELRVDGGPTRNKYLMQFQSDMLNIPVKIPDTEELSGIGAAYAAGIGIGLYDKHKIFSRLKRTGFTPEMEESEMEEKYKGWRAAVKKSLSNS